MPVINVEDLTDKDKAVMEVNQLKIEVKLERWLVSDGSVETGGFSEEKHIILEGHILKEERRLPRTPAENNHFSCLPQTSKCCEELKDYIQAGVDEDILVKGIPEEKNPFKEKGGCVVC